MIKYLEAQEREAVLALLGNAAFKRPLFDWQFELCDANRRPVTAVEDDTVVGFNGVMPVRVWLHGQTIDATWSCDFMVAHNSRRQGIGRKLKKALDNDWPLIIALGISPVGQLASRKAGWIPDDGPRRYARILVGHTWRNRVLAWFQQIGHQCLRSIGRTRLSQLTVSTSKHLPAKADINGLLEEVLAGYDGCVVRDWDYLEWRYARAPYGASYFFLPVHDGDKLVGLGIGSRTGSQISLVDFLGPNNNREIKQALVECLLANAIDAERVNCTTSDRQLQRVLLQQGFLPVRSSRMAFHIRDNRDNGVHRSAKWFLMGGDSDTEMLEQARIRWGELTLSAWDDDEFAMSRSEWDGLVQRTGADPLFMSWQWQRAWWTHFSKLNKLTLRIMAVHDRKSRLVALAPLCLRRTSVYGVPTRRLEALGNLWQGPGTMRSEYLEPLVDPDWLEPAASFIGSALHEKDDYHELVYSDAPQSSRAATQFLTAIGSRFLLRELVRPMEDETRFIALPDDFASYLDFLGSSTRRRLFGRRKLLESLGEIRLEYATADSLEAYFSKLNELHIERWGKPAFTGKTLEFHLDIAGEMLAANALRFSQLIVDGDTVSVLYNMIAGNREYNLQMGFDQNFGRGKLSLGLLHLGYAIEEAIRDGRTEFDLLAGAGKNELYKNRITNRGNQLCTWHIIRPNWRQLVYAAKDLRSATS